MSWGGVAKPMDDLVYMQIIAQEMDPYEPPLKDHTAEKEVTCAIGLYALLSFLYGNTPPAAIQKTKNMNEQSDYCDEPVAQPRPEKAPLIHRPAGLPMKLKAGAVVSDVEDAEEAARFSESEDQPSPVSVYHLHETAPPKMHKKLPAAYDAAGAKPMCSGAR